MLALNLSSAAPGPPGLPVLLRAHRVQAAMRGHPREEDTALLGGGPERSGGLGGSAHSRVEEACGHAVHQLHHVSVPHGPRGGVHHQLMPAGTGGWLGGSSGGPQQNHRAPGAARAPRSPTVGEGHFATVQPPQQFVPYRREILKKGNTEVYVTLL